MSFLNEVEAEELFRCFRDAIETALEHHAGEDPAIILYELQGLLTQAYIQERAYDKHLSFQLRSES